MLLFSKLYKHRYNTFEGTTSPSMRSNASVTSPLRATRMRLISDQKSDTSVTSPSIMKDKTKEPFEIIPKPMKIADLLQDAKSPISPLKGVTFANK